MNNNYYVSDVVKSVLENIMKSEKVNKGIEFIKRDHKNTIEEQKEICEIPAPSFKESKRSQEMMKRIKELGLKEVYIDEVGNVIAKRLGGGHGPKLVIAAHLDTVFPETVDTRVVEKEDKLYAPGIADDTRGLAEILSLIRAFNHTAIETIGDIIFVANVCEEGIGDLKGTKHLFEENKDIDGFISIDGTGVSSITYLATGSHRYKITYKGSGGHSYAEFGTPSAIHAMGRAIAKISDLKCPEDPKTTFTVGTVEGGTSVNSIAAEASMLIDIRSNNEEEIIKLEKQIIDKIKEGAEEENNRWKSDKKISVEIDLIGNRPAGTQSKESIIIQSICASTEVIGLVPELSNPGSTDANIPISMGIPGVAVGRGGKSGKIHSLEEWFDPKEAYLGPQKVFLSALALVGIKDLINPLLEIR
ncbi:M20/M25/M40 family metallo-hydrolase [Clostridium sp. MSJ-11]|uniref:M20/M25/M40 family metallo-hydrolase n=1 Tax=Clostridium mobile TaxID=2841512 RepID=A0ABS6EF01_9CLOT|nr:M20/M25/M40 family metallo-hydrolase [Clostridium mobile]MBU5483796.1 M20/M25/M40 family metallo-hydrolase [Clostridium mobile]